MISSIKINILLLPLLVSILLSTLSNLKAGKVVNDFFNIVLTPITYPTNKLRLNIQNYIEKITDLPTLTSEYQEQKVTIAKLLSENEHLKQIITDQKSTQSLTRNFGQTIPVRISGQNGKFIATSTQPLTNVLPGQPLVANDTLLGTVTTVSNSTLFITPIDNDKSPSFPIRTTSGQKGLYHFTSQQAQIIDVPSQSPLNIGEYVFTEPGEIFPGNLIVGKIIRISTLAQDPLQKADIELLGNLNSQPSNLIIITKP